MVCPKIKSTFVLGVGLALYAHTTPEVPKVLELALQSSGLYRFGFETSTSGTQPRFPCNGNTHMKKKGMEPSKFIFPPSLATSFHRMALMFDQIHQMLSCFRFGNTRPNRSLLVVSELPSLPCKPRIGSPVRGSP